jgi:hypothetical protein
MTAMIKGLGRNPWVYWGLGLYVAGVMAYFAMNHYFQSHRPHTMDPPSGRVYPLKHRGSIAYLTKQEDRLLQIIEFAPYGFLIAALLIHNRDLMRGRD